MQTFTGETPPRDSTVRLGSARPTEAGSRNRLTAIREIVISRWRIFFATSGLIFLITLIALLLIPRRFTSTGSFVVEAAPAAGLSSAMAIISQLNPNLAGGDSPKFYVDLVASRPVLEHLLALVPHAQCASPGQSVLQIISGSGTDAQNVAASVETLRHRVSAGYDLRTGVISVGVEAECPDLAREMADSLIASVNSFNIDRRQTRAKLRREFSEQRAREADSALQSVEDAMTGFQLANRVITTPRLALEADRLRRRISEREEMASSLRREASSARLEEINSIPALTIVEPPNAPVRASYPRRRVAVLFLLLFAGVVGAATALVRFAAAELPRDTSSAAANFHGEIRNLWLRRSPRVADRAI